MRRVAGDGGAPGIVPRIERRHPLLERERDQLGHQMVVARQFRIRGGRSVVRQISGGRGASGKRVAPRAEQRREHRESRDTAS